MKIIIKPKRGLSSLDFAEMWRYRELFYSLAWRDIKVRYRQTILGISWAVIQPLMTMVIFSVIFGGFAKIPSENIPYPIFSYSGLLLWNIFSSSLNNATASLVSNINIIQKVYLPRIIIPVSSISVSFIDFIFSALVFGGIMAYFRFSPNLAGLLLLPLLLFIIFLSVLGLGLFLSAFNIKYRDVRYVLPFFIQLLIFVSPVIYPISVVPEKYRWILYFNPMTGVIENFRASFLGTASINWMALGISVATSLIFLAFGLWYFLKTEKAFADII